MADIDKINELVGNKEFKEALELAATALIDEPDNIELIKLAGLAEVNMEDWEKAKYHFETVVKYSPDDATSWFYLANCYNSLGDFVSAKNSYLKVIELRKEYVEAYKSLCVVYLKLNLLPESIEYASRGQIYAPDDYIFDFVIGTAFMKLKDYDKSIEPLEQALKKAPDNMGIYNSLGTAYMALERKDDAIRCYEKALELNPENPMSYYNIGSAYQIMNDHKKACEYLQKAVELDEEDEIFKTSYAMSLVKTEQYYGAIDIYKKLLLQHPEKDNYKLNLITCYEALGDIQTAISMLEGIVYINPKFTLPAQKLANLYVKTNQLSKAKDLYDKIILKNSPTAEVMHQYAILSSSLCDTDTAEKILKKAIRMNPNLAKAHKDLAVIYLNKRLFDYAKDEFQTALKLAPNDFEVIFEYGNFLYSTSQNVEAERYYTEALEIQPDDILVLTFMALNKLVLNQLDEAKKYIMKALKINHHHEYIQFCAGRIMYARKEYEEAKRYLISAVEQNPDIETQNTLALTYYELGEYRQAINIFNNLLAKFPDNISIMKNLVNCYKQIGDNNKALEYLYKITDIIPEDEDSQELIRRLS